MTEGEVREVLARLAQEKMSPKVGDVADIAGASESDVRRILEELRAERVSVVGPPVVVPQTTQRVGQFPVAKGNRNVIAAILITVALIIGSLLMLMSLSVRTVQTSPPVVESSTTEVPSAPPVNPNP